MTPEQAGFLFDFLLPQLESEHRVTRKILSSVPVETETYRPDPKGKNAIELARHIAVLEMWFLDAIIHRAFGEVTPLPAAVTNCQDVAEWYAGSFASRLPALKACSHEDLAAPVDFIGLRNDPAVAYLNIAIRHSVHHRGQLSTYLRPMGAKVPAIYVESADEPFEIDASTLPLEQRPPAF